MKYIVSSKADFVEEIIDILKFEDGVKGYEDLRKTLCESYELSHYTKEKLNNAIDIVNYVYKNFKLKDEDKNFLFKKFKENNECIASTVLMIEDTLGMNLNKRYKYAKLSNKKQRIDIILKSYFEGMAEDISFLIININNEKEFFDFIDKQEISSEEKWTIQCMYFKFEEYLERTYKILKEAIKVLYECDNKVNELQKDFHDYWSRYLNNNSSINFIKYMTGADSENYIEELNIRMSLASFNSIKVELGEENNSSNMKLGLLFDGGFNVSIKSNNQDRIYKDLKIISDKSKFDILMYIKNKEAYGQELAEKFNLSKPTISHHMNALLSASFVKLRKDNNRLYYSMNKENIEKFLKELEKIVLK